MNAGPHDLVDLGTTAGQDLALAVRAADPIDFDRWARTVPAMNARADVPALTSLLADLVVGAPAPGASRVADLAAVRDIGLVMGSLRRHDVEPQVVVPGVGLPLARLAAATGMPPRDTILHYAHWNPVAERERTYTGDPQESGLIDSVRMVFPRLPAAIALCERLHGADPRDPGFAHVLGEVLDLLGVLVDSMHFVRSHVSPEFFTRELRPYLEGVSVDGVTYLGPAAAQLPIWLLDQALFPHRTAPRSEEYETFWRALVPYSVPGWRRQLRLWEDGGSIGDVVVAALRQDGADCGTALADSASALAGALRVLTRFRGMHLGIAQRAYDIEDRGFDVGSGGGSIDLLKEILGLTRQFANATGRRTTGQAAGA